MTETPHPALAPGRVAVITGAASGIGLAAARRFAGAGMRLALADLSPELEGAAELARQAGSPEVITRHLDVGEAGALAALRDEVFGRFGDVGVLMNNAAVGGGGSAFTNPVGWVQVLRTNLSGVL